ncbi:hypothetical protein [Pseudoponticoccus marisrubri]|uniref:Curlin n=1 Tax=Pseudoponticoccus marisrubri TaxID=1685382 RepID=A0A0W7WDT2_9RHOB|nr:hypothetical protein [Pseudoponticoccus marisrubri]KUF08631.1 hypothetical protein AVJ23_21810 [Pseudoponticoccus marisrubri]
MTLKITSRSAIAALLSTTVMTTAWADDNDAYLEQAGNNNMAYIDQSGDNNDVGFDNGLTGGGNIKGAVRQEQIFSGAGNDLDIFQSGDGNKVGTVQAPGTSASVLQRSQNGPSNTLLVTQSSDDNTVERISQIARIPGTAANTVTITQEVGDDNLIGFVSQDRKGGTGHTATLTQTGADNIILRTRQQNNNSILVATQEGTGNLINEIRQQGSGFNSNDGNHEAYVVQDGDNNGTSDFSAGSFAAGTGAAWSKVEQYGNDNDVDYLAVGNANLFGFYQDGTGNSVGMVTIDGDGNETAGYQEGTDNLIVIAPIVGDDNDIGVIQDGTMNMADIALTNGSSRNAIGVDQFGTNAADVDVDGNDNFADIRQSVNNSGSFGVVLNITGDFNGTGPWVTGSDAESIGLTGGVIIQDGVDNLFDAVIEGDNNLFASDQFGNDNTIDAFVDGNNNQFAVAQMGNMNNAVFSQIGAGNNVGISQ